MSIQNGCVLTKEGIEYLCGLIRDINGLDTKLIDDLTSVVLKKEVDCKYDLELELDTFELFMFIARDTFIECSELEDNNLLKNIE